MRAVRAECGWGIQGRAIGFCVLTVLGTVGIVSAVLIERHYRDSIQRLTQQAVAHARSLAQSAAPAVLLGDHDEVARTLRAAASDETIEFADIRGRHCPHGATHPSFQRNASFVPQVPLDVMPPMDGSVTRGAVRVERTADQLLVVVPVWPDVTEIDLSDVEETAAAASGPVHQAEEPVGFVFLVYGLDKVHAELASRVRWSIAVAIAVVAVGIAVTIVMIRRLVTPIRDLAATTIGLAEGDLSTRASEEAVGEIGLLARSFNHMADRLQESYASIERRVAERTAELEIRRRELQEEVAERQRTEAQLLSEKHFSDAVIDGLPGVFYLFDHEGHYLRWNKNLERVSGYSSAEMGRMHPLKFFAGDDVQVIRERMEEVFEKGAAAAEAHLVAKDGTRTPYLFTGIRIILDGKPCLLGMGVDMAESKRAATALQDSEERLRTVISASKDAIIAIGEDGLITLFNPAAEQMFGWSASEMLGHTPDGLMPAEYRAQHRQYVEGYFTRGEPNAAIGQRVELPAVRSDGRQFPVELSLSTGQYAEKRFALAVARDITERKRTETELQQAKEAAEAASRAKSEFLANMSHEIRTPMNGVIGMTELVLGTNLSPEQRENLETVLGCANSLLSLLNDILDLSKIEAGKLEFETTPLDLIELVEDVAGMFAHRAAAKGLELVCRIDPRVPRFVQGDPVRLRQVLVNLVGNAVKFTETGEVIVGVGVQGEDADAVRLEFQVSDTGIGIPKERQAAVFDAFMQVDGTTTRKYGGTGLGLAISRQIVDRLGGRIEIDSEPGRGSVFRFSISLQRSGPVESRPIDPVDTEADLNGRRILIVDDNATNRRVLEVVLSSWGCEAAVAADGPLAIQLAREACAAGRPFHAALLDVHMPGMDGLEVQRHLEEDAACGRPAIIFLSSLSSRRELKTNDAGRRTPSLTKPIKQAPLRDALIRVLTGRISDRPVPATAAAPSPDGDRRRFRARILVAEDVPANARVAHGILQNLGCDVMVAENGLAAVEILDQQSFDLVFLDVQMPEMDGFAVARQLRRDERFQHLPLIAMTAHAMKEDRARCLAAGMDDYVTKPLSAAVVRDVITRWVDRRGSKNPVANADGTDADLAPDDAASADSRPADAAARRASPADAPPAAVITNEAVAEPAQADPMAIEQALQNLAGDRELLFEVLDVFMQTVPQLVDELRAAAGDADAARLGAAAHNLKGAASNVCAVAVRQTAQQLEAAARTNELAEAGRLVSDLDAQLARLRAYVSTLRNG